MPDEQSMTTAEAIEAIRVASFEAPKAHSHTEWAARIEAVLVAHASLVTRGLRARLDASQLSDIEARNPGIDMEQVRASRVGRV